jgi:hypothetical protein
VTYTSEWSAIIAGTWTEAVLATDTGNTTMAATIVIPHGTAPRLSLRGYPGVWI